MNGQHFLIYVTEEGGVFKTPMDGAGHVRKFTPDEYQEIKASGEFTYNAEPWSDNPLLVTETPVFIALAEVVDNYDFINQAERPALAVSG